ncbi:TspO/MBR family protein [Caulobacter sp. 17J80-11]|uniref:TspO/MBR family protein n=1 Tax=Caulobacter sp. 17J80-11 TaxID=2763502 RepID=UPI001653AF0C|nr:TspO/MBR family protein [Caulobacter sp. 17J80-11]MBC6982603.1 tryptophan-rich sensory protein [Caulobacter sp. 17J80-11]
MSDLARRRRSDFYSAAAFVAACVGVSLAIGWVARPGEWYADLVKPAFNPPSWVFGPVWTFLYILIGIAGWRTWRVAPKSAAMAWWGVQMGLNWLWSPAFFGAQRPWLAFAVILALLGAIVAYIAAAWRQDRTAAWLFIPYAAWVAFAGTLNGFIATAN